VSVLAWTWLVTGWIVALAMKQTTFAVSESDLVDGGLAELEEPR
jgi:hypothetical protein